MDYYSTFLKIMKDIEKNYSYLKFKRYSVKDIEKKFENKFKRIKNDESFTKLLAEIFWLFEDPHMWIINKNVNISYKIRKLEFKENYDYELLFKKYLSNKIIKQNSAGTIAYYKDIFYINFLTWNNGKRKEIESLLKQIEKEILKNNPKKIIIDVRANHGGNDRLSQILLSYFIPKESKIFVVRSKYRKSKTDPNKIGKEKKIYQKNNTSVYSDAKVCVLIGNSCMSSNEYMVLGFQALKNKNKKQRERIFLVGDKTFGSSGNPKTFEYENKFTIGIPSWIRFFPNGELFEGKGVSPDIYISSKKSITENKDLVFEKAVEILNKK